MRLSELTEVGSLAALFAQVRSRSQAAGTDGIAPEAFARGLEDRLRALAEALRTETWQPSALVRIRRDKPGGGVRVLAIPTVEDRVVIELLRTAIEPEVEPLLSRAAFAYRPRRSAREAVDAVSERIARGAGWIAHADIRDFFDSIRLDAVLDAVGDLTTDAPLVRLLGRVLRRHARSPGRGLAQGSALSPLLSNVALLPLDRRLCAAGFDLVRYSDNLCVVAKAQPEAEEALRAMDAEMRRLGLAMKREKSGVADVRQGVLWLGFWIGEAGRRIGDGAIQALRARIERAARGADATALHHRLAPIVRGWAQYFDAPLPEGMTFGEHDALVRQLLAEVSKSPPMHTVAEAAASEQRTDPRSVHAAADGEVEALETEAWDEDDWKHLSDSQRKDDLLSTADRLAAEGDYAGAEVAFERAQQPEPDIGTPIVAPAVDVGADDEAIDSFLGMFAAGQERIETAEAAASGRRDFRVMDRPPCPADVRAHLGGRAAMAVRPRLSDGTCTIAVVDIDAPETAGLPAARACAGALAAVAEAWGWHVLIEETGGRGLHVWIPIQGRPRADVIARALEALKTEAGTPKEGVRVELLPSRDDAPDLHAQAITLPLGLHLETGERSRLRWASGPELEPDLRGLFTRPLNEPAMLQARLPAGGSLPAVEKGIEGPQPHAPGDARLPVWQSFGSGVSRVMEGCAVLRHLAEKAASVGHLNHAERLSLLYSLGHLGPHGHQAIHAIVARCNNYDAAETARQIDRLAGLPISCTRMREKHGTPELLPLCRCDFGNVGARGGYATPVLHASGFRHSWRAVLRGREAHERARPAEVPGVRAVGDDREPPARRQAVTALDPSRPPAPPPPSETADDGVVVKGTPPHEWA